MSGMQLLKAGSKHPNLGQMQLELEYLVRAQQGAEGLNTAFGFQHLKIYVVIFPHAGKHSW
jgi:hypothetical protein